MRKKSQSSSKRSSSVKSRENSDDGNSDNICGSSKISDNVIFSFFRWKLNEFYKKF